MKKLLTAVLAVVAISSAYADNDRFRVTDHPPEFRLATEKCPVYCRV